MAIGDIYAVKMRFTQTTSGKLIAPGYHIQHVSGGNPTAAQANSFVVNMWTNVKSLFSSDTVLAGVTLRKVRPIEPIEVLDATGCPAAGTGAASSDLPTATAIVISLRTSLIGKSYRGRTYFPAPAEAASDGNLIAADAQTIADEWEAMRLGWDALGKPMCVYSRVVDVGTDLTEVRVDQRFRTQRRRQVRGGTYSIGV